VTFDDILAAAGRLKGHARVTPMLTSPFLDRIAGRRVLVKADALQKTGSFKYRGARVGAVGPGPDLRATASSPIRRATTRRAWRWPRPSSACRR
jgi:threonine dehydratase